MNAKQVVLRSGTKITEAVSGTGRAYEVHGETYGPVWVMSDGAYGWPRALVVADSWEDAYYAAADALPAIDAGDLWMFSDYDEYTFHMLESAAVAGAGVREYPELHGVHYQDCGQGTGVADTADLSVRPLTVADARESFALTVEAY